MKITGKEKTEEKESRSRRKADYLLSLIHISEPTRH